MGSVGRLSSFGIVVLSFITLLFFSRYFNHAPGHSSALAPPDPIFGVHDADTHLFRRDDYTCGPKRPCENGACCGASGNCGYGDDYCGKGCQSNCDAAAECGKDANPAGKLCPLSTCCSEFGFCGTTKEFCTGKCQSNCTLHPEPPKGSQKNKTLSKVIGYYESWSDRLACHQMAPSDLPLSELTHLNYAFVYIDPESYELVTMDSQTPERLFSLTVEAKDYNSELEVWISVGGWAFSDNNTATQPVFGDIAAKGENRQKFADNVVRFLDHYGFDGIDIDWEYPGAPDRGGKFEDTKNFVELMKTLRSTFDKSPRNLGLTFTIPSSYWYLRWFDMPGMMKYADWTNLMSYDLHGTWDRNNAIGNLVQGHTNLTEIKQAAELLWRVGIKPEQVAMGFGFYGRSFKLEDPGCSKPGCRFKGDATPGSCSSTSGIIMYYEIQALLDQGRNLNPVHDEEAAVNYLVYNKDQWVSYDNGTTFQQKLDWANEIGIGGSLIWASDTDDDKYTAMRGLIGEKVSHPDLSQKAIRSNSITVIQNLVGQNGQDCKLMDDCVDPDIIRCPDGWHKAGWDKGDKACGSGGKLICCPASTAPRSCTWRGSGGDCNGQCHSGEATLFKSSWGGGFNAESSTAKCSRGAKVFCCDAGNWKQATQGCYWSHCVDDCKSGEKAVSGTKDGCFLGTSKYCCPSDTPIHDCTWRGSKFDCEDAKCEGDEVSIRNDPQGNSGWACSWGRKKTNCCKVTKAPPPSLKCNVTTCDIDPGLCSIAAEGGYTKRDVPIHTLEKRGGKRDFNWPLYGYLTNNLYQLMRSRAYPGRDAYMRNLRHRMAGLASRWWYMRSESCGRPDLRSAHISSNREAPFGAEVEHPVPLAVVSRFAASANHGRLYTQRPIMDLESQIPQGPQTRTPRIGNDFWQRVWNQANALPAGLPRISDQSDDIRTPSQRIYEALGSSTNPSHFTLLQNGVNAVKNSLENFKRPMAPARFNREIASALVGDEMAIRTIMAPLRETVAMFQYLNSDDVVTRMDTIVAGVYQQLQLVERNTEGGDGLAAHWNELYPHYFSQVSEFARTWAAGHIRVIRTRFEASENPYRESILQELLEIENKIPDMRYAFEDKD